jgi:uncharacterized protein (TIGR02271 family)
MASRNEPRTAAQAADAGHDVRPLPLQAAVEARAAGWSVRLPVRAEHVNVTKEAVFLEEVRIWRARHEETQAVTASVRGERLLVDDSHGPANP